MAGKTTYQKEAEAKRASEGGSYGVSAEAGAEDRQAAAKVTERSTGFTAAKAGATGPAPPKFDLTTPEGREQLRAWRQKKQAAIK